MDGVAAGGAARAHGPGEPGGGLGDGGCLDPEVPARERAFPLGRAFDVRGLHLPGRTTRRWRRPPGWVRLERKGDELIGCVLDGRRDLDGVPGAADARPGAPGALLVGIFGIGKEPTGGRSAFEALRGRACLEGTAPRFIRGDANEDGSVDLSDAVSILIQLFLGGVATTCDDADDANDDGESNISDAISLLGFLFLGGAAPPAPFPECGEDPTEDELGCESFAGCR